jgi:hypothetical protein
LPPCSAAASPRPATTISGACSATTPPRSLALLAILLGLQLAACAETPEHKAAIEEMDRRHEWVVETMSGSGGK